MRKPSDLMAVRRPYRRCRRLQRDRTRLVCRGRWRESRARSVRQPCSLRPRHSRLAPHAHGREEAAGSRGTSVSFTSPVLRERWPAGPEGESHRRGLANSRSEIPQDHLCGLPPPPADGPPPPYDGGGTIGVKCPARAPSRRAASARAWTSPCTVGLTQARGHLPDKHQRTVRRRPGACARRRKRVEAEGDMRGQGDVVHAEQRDCCGRPARSRARSSPAPAIQPSCSRLDHRRLVDRRAAAGVHEQGGLLHRAGSAAPSRGDGRPWCRRMHRDDV